MAAGPERSFPSKVTEIVYQQLWSDCWPEAKPIYKDDSLVYSSAEERFNCHLDVFPENSWIVNKQKN